MIEIAGAVVSFIIFVTTLIIFIEKTKKNKVILYHQHKQH